MSIRKAIICMLRFYSLLKPPVIPMPSFILTVIEHISCSHHNHKHCYTPSLSVHHLVAAFLNMFSPSLPLVLSHYVMCTHCIPIACHGRQQAYVNSPSSKWLHPILGENRRCKSASTKLKKLVATCLKAAVSFEPHQWQMHFHCTIVDLSAKYIWQPCITSLTDQLYWYHLWRIQKYVLLEPVQVLPIARPKTDNFICSRESNWKQHSHLQLRLCHIHNLTSHLTKSAKLTILKSKNV